MMSNANKPLPLGGGVGVGPCRTGLDPLLPHPPTPSPAGEGEK